jgi:hypothetical protein
MAGTIIADAVQAASTSQLNIKNGVALTPPTISDVNNVAIGTFCRAWVNFNGSGTVAISASFNVTSITDNGVGDFTVNMTNAMPDANYAALSTVRFVAGGTYIFSNIHNTVAPTTTAVRFLTGSTSGNADPTIYNVAVFR